jgi:AraC-like DNA-binding protein
MAYADLPAFPRLPFGETIAKLDTCVQSMCETVGKAISGDWDIDPRGPNPFRQKSSYVLVGEVSLATTICSPILVRRDEQPYATLRIPTLDHSVYRVEGRRLFERRGRSAVLLSGMRREALTSNVSGSVHVALDRGRLRRTMTTMLGVREGGGDILRLEEDREIPLRTGGVDFNLFLGQHFAIIDSLARRPSALAALGLDDVLYRAFVMMLAPEAFLGVRPRIAGAGHVADRIELVCQFVLANIGRTITLTELESLSGLSSRTLQYEFLRRFQCTPMEWVRKERLVHARKTLLNAGPETSVLSVAFECGFTNAGRFAQHYREHFGEPPSQTLARARS